MLYNSDIEHRTSGVQQFLCKGHGLQLKNTEINIYNNYFVTTVIYKSVNLSIFLITNIDSDETVSFVTLRLT